MTQDKIHDNIINMLINFKESGCYMIILSFFRFLLYLLLKLVYFILFILNIIIIFIAGLGYITAQIGKIILFISGFIMIISTLPHFFSLPEKTFKDVWENILLFLVIPLPFLFLTNISTLISTSITKLKQKVYLATESLSTPLRGTKKYYEENKRQYLKHMKELNSQSKKG